MYATPVPFPIELLNSSSHTRKYSPSIHLQVSVSVMVPPPPIGPGFISPRILHEPAKTLSFFSSSGFGISIWALAETPTPRIMADNTTAGSNLMTSPHLRKDLQRQPDTRRRNTSCQRDDCGLGSVVTVYALSSFRSS